MSKRLSGVACIATDIDFHFGQGHTVEGTAQDILLAAIGRKEALGRLTGAGVAILRERSD